MDRRKFISVSGISLVGLNGIVSASSLLFQKGNLQKVTNFLELIGAERLYKKLSDLQNNYIQHACKTWVQLGYKNSDGLIWKAGNNTIVCPMQLSPDSITNIDQVVLVFTIQKNGDLIYNGILSGFHLEVIEINKKELLQLGDASYIRACILPALEMSHSKDGGWALTTEKGYFELAVKIEKDKTIVSSALKVGNQFVWQNSILSNHSLYHQSSSIV